MISIRTATCAKKGLFADFDLSLFCDVAADGSPFLSLHSISIADRYIGSVYRMMAVLPWQVQLAGEPEPKTVGEDFQQAVDRLIRWDESHRKEVDDYFAKIPMYRGR
jgi:hypothetical protein